MKNIQATRLDAMGNLIVLKDEQWIATQRRAGKIAAQTLILLEGLVKEKTTKTLMELNTIAENYITSHEGASCTFKRYKGFPAGCCISVNKSLVHGIPTDYQLQDGDLVSFDLGVTIDGVIADTALTCIYGQPKSERHLELLQATEEALMSAIQAIEVGKKLGVIGHTISQVAKKYGFGVIEQYGGHGIDLNKPHSTPFVHNRSNPNEGITIQKGLTIAIEPLFVLGSDTQTHTLSDGWTVMCEDICAHHEHSISINMDGQVEIITARNYETNLS
jgi:methionyl aminopeptidase